MAFLTLVVFLMGAALFNANSTVPDSAMAPTVQPGRATLKIVGVNPLAVSGRAFKPGERVRLSADGLRKSVTAGPRGGFNVKFPEANVCNGVVVQARGSEGSRASVSYAQFSNVHCLEPGVMSATGAPSARKAALRVVANSPLTVRGDAFQPGERVRLTALGSIKRLTRTTTANERGAFKASFPALGGDHCSLLVVAAVGSMGSRASASLGYRRRACNPPRVPPRRE